MQFFKYIARVHVRIQLATLRCTHVVALDRFQERPLISFMSIYVIFRMVADISFQNLPK